MLEMSLECSYWTSAHDRIESQFVVWNSDRELDPDNFVTMGDFKAT
jgi:hypothetical protein